MLSRRVRAIAFWTAIGLPIVHVPLLLTGLDSRTDTLAFVLLLSANLFALVVGHGYESR